MMAACLTRSVSLFDHGSYKYRMCYTDNKVGSKMSKEKRQDLADELKNFVEKGNAKDLARAVDIQR